MLKIRSRSGRNLKILQSFVAERHPIEIKYVQNENITHAKTQKRKDNAKKNNRAVFRSFLCESFAPWRLCVRNDCPIIASILVANKVSGVGKY